MADDDQKSERAAEVTGAHGHHHHHEPDGETPSGHVDHDPVCGMALEPLIAAADAGPSPELADMTRRFWIGLALALPVFLLEMGGHLIPALHHLVPMHISIWIQFALATPVVLWAGWPFFARGWASIVNRSLNMFTLIAMGTGVAWGYSIVATFAPQLFPQAFRDADGAVAVYYGTGERMVENVR